MTHITPAKILPATQNDPANPQNQTTWQSAQYPDTYFSVGNPLLEKHHVFIQANNLAKRFATLTQPQFTIIETGFGTGLNFLLTASAWEENTQNLKTKHYLNYISIEKFPIQLKDLKKIHSQWPTLNTWTKRLQNQYPALLPTTHTLHFKKSNITLTLILADIQHALEQIQQDPHIKADAWFLDGFSPSINPDMWPQKLFTTLTQASTKNATLSTYTAAGFIRRALKNAGFNVTKTKGFGKKREMTVAQFKDAPTAYSSKTPWLTPPKTDSPKTAIVIGAGLAGSAAAQALASKNIKVTLIERNDIAQGASGNHTGIFQPLLSKDFNIPSQFQLAAFLATKKHLQKLQQRHQINYSKTGLTQIHLDQDEFQKQKEIQRALNWPKNFFNVLDPKQTQSKLNLTTHHGATHFHQAGSLHPPALVSANLQHPNIKTITQQNVVQIKHQDNRWHAIDKNNHTIATAHTLIIANASDALAFKQTAPLQLHPIIGQTTLLSANPMSQKTINTPLTFGQYITPAYLGYHTLGATFIPQRWPVTTPQTTTAQHISNIQMLQQKCPQIAQTLDLNLKQNFLGKASHRCATPDRMPIIGPMPNIEKFKEIYHDHHQGKHHKQYPKPIYHPNLYLSLAHGARGINSSILAAQYLANIITQSPTHLHPQIISAIHPARQIMKKLKHP